LADLRAADWDEIVASSGVGREQIKRGGGPGDAFEGDDLLLGDGAHAATRGGGDDPDASSISCSCGGDSGRPGAGACPVRGHSNVQGDRTMGIFERMPGWWLDRLDAEFGFKSPRAHGLDTVDAIKAMHDGR
jgi:predicted molibdopterin-dependent oxidoreductase YjgC